MARHVDSLPKGYGKADKNLEPLVQDRSKVFLMSLAFLIGSSLVLNHFYPVLGTLMDKEGRLIHPSSLIGKIIMVVIFIAFYAAFKELLRQQILVRTVAINAPLKVEGGMIRAIPEGYLDKSAVSILLILPIISITIFLTLVAIFLPRDWLWFVLFLMLMNVSFGFFDIRRQQTLKQLPEEALISLETHPWQVYLPGLAEPEPKRKHLKRRK